MKILVARIPEEGSHYEGTDPASILELEGDPLVRVGADLEYDLHAQRVSGELVVRGTLSVELDLRCTRCAEFFSTTLSVSDFLRAYSVPEEVDSVDLTADLREELLLRLPAFPVCDPTCKGLCAQCGADLNKTPCVCEKDDDIGPWDVLNGLDL